MVVIRRGLLLLIAANSQQVCRPLLGRYALSPHDVF